MDITIRPAESIADYRACQQAQRRAWGLDDESYVVPIATMVGAQYHGGLVLGAFLADGEAVGLSFAFLGRSSDRPCLYSQLTGVVPGYQGQGIGSRIKEFQRDYARSLGLAFVAWSFDPLRAGNAQFNLNRLGASSNRYIEDMYGPRTDSLNSGVPTDRLIAEWSTDAGTVREGGIGWKDSPRLVEGLDEPRLMRFDAMDMSQIVLIEIPREIGRLRAEDPARAERWRLAVGSAMSEAFASSYRAIDLIYDGERPFYVLRR